MITPVQAVHLRSGTLDLSCSNLRVYAIFSLIGDHRRCISLITSNRNKTPTLYWVSLNIDPKQNGFA